MTVDNGFMDVGPMNVTGVITARRARVMWKDGVLHVFTSPTSVRSVASSEPVQTGSDWTATTDEGDVSFTRRGCSSCSWQLGRYNALDLLAKT